MVVHCFWICSGSALLRVSRSVEREFLPVLSYLLSYTLECTSLSFIIVLCIVFVVFSVLVVLV